MNWDKIKRSYSERCLERPAENAGEAIWRHQVQTLGSATVPREGENRTRTAPGKTMTEKVPYPNPGAQGIPARTSKPKLGHRERAENQHTETDHVNSEKHPGCQSDSNKTENSGMVFFFYYMERSLHLETIRSENISRT